MGVLADASLSEQDLAKGLYDDAKVTLHLVNWQDVSQRTILRSRRSRRGRALGSKLRRRGARPRAQARRGRGPALPLRCDADFGDARCGVDLTDAAFRATGAVAASQFRARRSSPRASAPSPASIFRAGRLLWTGGGNSGGAAEVKRHTLERCRAHDRAVAAAGARDRTGDALHADRRLRQAVRDLRGEVRDQARFRGFPHMPATIGRSSHAGGQDIMDGGVGTRDERVALPCADGSRAAVPAQGGDRT